MLVLRNVTRETSLEASNIPIFSVVAHVFAVVHICMYLTFHSVAIAAANLLEFAYIN